MKKVFFPKRIPEPKIMEELEMKAFEELSQESYNRWMIPLTDEALDYAKLKDRGLILDLACGPGLLTKEIALRSKYIEVFALDASPHALRLAKKNCEGLANITFKKGSVYALPFHDDYFDLVICKDSLHHFDKPLKAIKEMGRVVKKGGVLYVQDLRRDLPFYLLKRSMPPHTMIQKLQFYSARAAYTVKEMRKILKTLHIPFYTIRTRRVTLPLRKRYEGKMDMQKLKESFQARYTLTIKKR